jgi:hypothetical protein
MAPNDGAPRPRASRRAGPVVTGDLLEAARTAIAAALSSASEEITIQVMYFAQARVAIAQAATELRELQGILLVKEREISVRYRSKLQIATPER